VCGEEVEFVGVKTGRCVSMLTEYSNLLNFLDLASLVALYMVCKITRRLVNGRLWGENRLGLYDACD